MLKITSSACLSVIMMIFYGCLLYCNMLAVQRFVWAVFIAVYQGRAVSDAVSIDQERLLVCFNQTFISSKPITKI